MYAAHFGLRELPFGITPDTSYFFACPGYQQALNTLLIAAESGEGFIKITGEVGVGKTLLCRKFMNALKDTSFVTAYIPNPYIEPRSLMMAVAAELEITLEKDMDQYRVLQSIYHRLLDLAREGKRVVLCLDEAQAMPLETLEALRLLTNLETEKRKLLQIVMFGQPELERKLQDPAIRQLNQRISFHYHLGPLGKDDMEYYISHRLKVAGFSGSRLFDRSAINRIYTASGGIPRLVNILSHKSMMLAFGQGKQRVNWRHALAAGRDTGAARKGMGGWIWAGGLLVGLVTAGASAGWVYLR